MNKPTSFELSERVMSEPGSLREIGVALGISKGYVSMLKKARANCAAQVINAWSESAIPWALVRGLSNLPKGEQLPILAEYKSVANATVGKGRAARKAVLTNILRRIRDERGVGISSTKRAEIIAEAEALYGCEECEIEKSQRVVPGGDDGFWVTAMVWVPAENISTKD